MRVGFIGLGVMGAPMAANLARAGHALKVHDLRRTDVAGAAWAASPAAAVTDAQILFTSLPGPTEVEAVAKQIAGALPRGAAWFDLTTNSPACVRRLHGEMLAHGVQVLDAPVSGGPQGAKSGKLALWVSGDKAAFDKHKAVLDAIGDQAVYIGPVGAGTVAKLVHNCAGYAILAALAEVFTLGVKAGVEPLALWSAVRQGAFGRKRSFDRLAEQFLIGKFDPPAFALELAHKDVTLATDLGREFHVPLKIATLVHQEMTEAMNREGWAKRDSRIFMLLQEERAGVDIKVAPEKVQQVLDRG